MSGMQCHTYLFLMLSLESNMFILVVFLSCTSLTIALQERPSKWFRLLLDFLTPRIMFVLVSWARVQRHICSRMHIHTRAYVTKKKPHVHDHCHVCPVASSCPTAPVDIRPRPPMNLAAPQPDPRPHTRPAAAGACSPVQCRPCGLPRGMLQLASAAAHTHTWPAQASALPAERPREQGSTAGWHGQSKVARGRSKAAAARGHA
jgi:hypothetical protein